jgi:hypothetical protein
MINDKQLLVISHQRAQLIENELVAINYTPN